MQLALWFLVSVNLWGQQSPATKTEEVAIQRVRKLPVSKLDHMLPNISLEFFLKSEGGGRPIKWEVNDCAEVTGDPAADEGREMCVEAGMDTSDGHVIAVLVSVGTFNKGIVGAPELFSARLSIRPDWFTRCVT
jgi:hypothetical protein